MLRNVLHDVTRQGDPAGSTSSTSRSASVPPVDAPMQTIRSVSTTTRPGTGCGRTASAESFASTSCRGGRLPRSLPSCTGEPILYLSSESDAGIKQQAKAAGATGWITKPFKPEQLLAVVGKLVRA